MSKLTAIVVVLTAGVLLAAPARGEVLTNNGDSWVRENGPTATFAGDLISVWNSVAGDRRYGVVSFDVGSLSEPVTAVALSLWSQAFGFSDDALPLKQTAIAIDPVGIVADAATWEQVTAAATLHTFEGLGTHDIGAPGSDPALDGVSLESLGTAADIAFVESVRTGGGTLLVVLIGDEADGVDYKASWGDGEFGGEDAVLKTNADLEVPDDPNLAVNQTLEFGTVNPGEAPLVQSLTIGNTGAMEILTISAASITGPDAAKFAVTAGTFPLQIDAGQSSDLEITFDPGADLGFFAATLELASDDPSDGVIMVALNGTSEVPKLTLINNGDSWVRETAPATTYGADLMSVWNGTGGDRRYGVVSFDLSSLSGPVGGVSLSLWSQVFGFSDDPLPLKQTAIAIDPTGIDPDLATWDQVAGAPVLYTFESLGAVDIGGPGVDPEIDGVFIESAGTPADAAFVESVRTGSGTLMVVMIGDEGDGENYRGSWGDGEFGGEDAFLTLEPLGTRAQLQIHYDQGTGELSISWQSKMGLLYNLRSEVELTSEPATWPIFANLENIPAEASGINTVTIPLPVDAERFFVVEQFPAPPVAVFAENFDGAAGPDLPAGWTTGTGPGDTGTTAWELGTPSQVGPPSAQSAPNCVATNLSADYGFDTDISLRTPPIDVTTASSATLSFQQFTDIEESFDFGTVSILDAADDSELAVLLDTVDGVTADWSKISRAIPASALGKTIKIEFRFQADDVSSFAGWYLDDVEVTVP